MKNIQSALFFKDISSLAKSLERKFGHSKLFVLTDEAVHEHCLGLLQQEFHADHNLDIIEVAQGENSKTIEIYQQICLQLAEYGAEKNDLLICLGGGMVTDLGGFIGTTFKRGIRFVHIPTSLMGMVDAANGGKNGVNLGDIKNAIGTISQPEAIMIAPEFLRTLPDQEIHSGFAEMIKHSIIEGGELWKQIKKIKKLTVESVAQVLPSAYAVKEKITKEDFYETGLRKILNFGHSIGHAIESYFLSKQTPITHGEAVALGMICETMIAVHIGRLSNAEAQTILETLIRWFPPKEYVMPEFSEFHGFLQQDKKNTSGKLYFSLPKAIGQIEYNIEVTPTIASDAYNRVRLFSQNGSKGIPYLVSTI